MTQPSNSHAPLQTMKLPVVSRSVGHSGRVLSVRWSPDEKQVVTVGSDCCVAVWNFYGL
jgi:WD40 repeat protein